MDRYDNRDRFGSKSRKRNLAVDRNFNKEKKDPHTSRPAALERKNRLFYCSHAGARAACVIRSFTETCKQCGAAIYEFFLNFFNGVAMGRTDYEYRIEREQSQAVSLNYAERVAIPERNMMPWCVVTNR